MRIADSVALVTGANRGLGRHFARELTERGAKVYATARRPEAIDLPGVIPLGLDITDPASVAAAAKAAGDVTLLVNNAGSSTKASLLHGDIAEIRLEMETHFFGTLAASREFAPVLKANGGGAILNILSVLSWIASDESGAYSAAKSAEWALTNSLRLQLAAQGTFVSGLHVGYMDTDMAAHVEGPKSDPAKVAAFALDELEAGQIEILADPLSGAVKSRLAGPVAAMYPQLAAL
ncbi:MAG TPA: SDR family oxidoreductase [Mycobacteriales bacterium]|jgi:NAD(P)-dependent dehydrogenase (short-subunit alcohol dehydrogenase family)|nr:SDR family oxidoreductase [Mycobacteriales bacterium]